jgi:hypothetical protein
VICAVRFLSCHVKKTWTSHTDGTQTESEPIRDGGKTVGKPHQAPATEMTPKLIPGVTSAATRQENGMTVCGCSSKVVPMSCTGNWTVPDDFGVARGG